MAKNLLMIFIKNPVEGKVKTRLGASIGSANALQVYKKLLNHTREVALQVSLNRQVWYSSMIDHRDSWSSDEFSKQLQKGADLGERMSSAFESAFNGGYHKVVIIGSDCFGLSHQHIEKAFQALDEHDGVIGPSKDGGYYLLGMNRNFPQLFNDIEWSTPEVFDKTIEHFRNHGLSFSILDVLNDIDTIEDLRESNISLP
jgi:rSAM/selenodomain-associated transferase 1